MIDIAGLGLTYQAPNGEIQALRDLDLYVDKGEFVCIVGPSGCGKSTLLSILAGLVAPTAGEARIAGQKVAGPSPLVGYMLQADHLFDWRTILENALLGLEIRRELTPASKAYVLDLLATYGLLDFRDKYPRQLSGGMRQRAALIRTLAARPEILLLDEAFSGLDYQTRLAVTEDIHGIIKREGKTALLVTHDIAESISMADRVVVLSARPGTIKSIHRIELTCARRTPIGSRDAPEFRRYFNLIREELDIHGR